MRSVFLYKKSAFYLCISYIFTNFAASIQMKTVKTLHFDAINTMYISAQRDFDCPRRAGVFVCVLGR